MSYQTKALLCSGSAQPCHVVSFKPSSQLLSPVSSDKASGGQGLHTRPIFTLSPKPENVAVMLKSAWSKAKTKLSSSKSDGARALQTVVHKRPKPFPANL